MRSVSSLPSGTFNHVPCPGISCTQSSSRSSSCGARRITGRRPAVWPPGEYLVIDWAHRPRRDCSCLCGAGVLAVAVRAVRRRSEGHHHGGDDRRGASGDRRCPGQGAGGPDGLPEGGVVADVVVPTADYVRLASHYGFAPDWCQGGDNRSRRASWSTRAGMRSRIWWYRW